MAALVIAFAVPDTSAAQGAAPSGVIARPGELVRVRTAEWEYTGTLDRVANDTAVVRFATDSARIPRAFVVRTEVQRGTRRSGTRITLGAIGGAAAGMVAGAFLGAMLECGGTSCDGGQGYEGLAGGFAGAALGLVTGALSGGIWGSQKRYPRWIPAQLP
jgi:hypothetical protein